MRKPESRGARSGGYALAVTIIFVTVAVTVAAGLAITRQMWGQMGEKQLHRILTQTAMDVDGLAMISLLRQGVEGNGVSTVSLSSAAFTPRTVLSITPLTSDPNGTPVVYQTSTRIAVPTEWAATGAFPLNANLFYDQLLDTPSNSVMGMWDPFREIWSVSSGFGIMTQNELSGGVRANKSVKPVRDEAGEWESGSRLHAWLEVDTAKLYEVAVRRLPASAFTLFAPEISGSSETMLLGNWAAGGSSSIGVGRYYTEMPVSPGRQGVVLNYPMVATGGLNWGAPGWNDNGGSFSISMLNMGSTGGLYPDELGEDHVNYQRVNNVMASPNKGEFYKSRYTKFGGMISTGLDRPVKLTQFGGDSASLVGVEGVSGSVVLGWMAPDVGDASYGFQVAADAPNLLAQLWNRADVRIYRTGPGEAKVWLANGGEWPELEPCVVVNDTTQEITVNLTNVPPSTVNPFEDWRSAIVFVESGGVNDVGVELTDLERAQYKVRVICPDVDSLGWATSAFAPNGKGGLTIASSHPVILDGGFNQNGASVPAMVVAQNIAVAAPLVGYPATLKGVFVTVGCEMDANGDPLKWAFQSELGREPYHVYLMGSVIFWNRMANKPLVTGWSSPTVFLNSDNLYLSGKCFPPGVPALLDTRFAKEQLLNYRIYSEDTTLSSPGSSL